MKKVDPNYCPDLFLSYFNGTTYMRPIEELINAKDPGWPIVEEWIAAAKNKVEVPCDTGKAKGSENFLGPRLRPALRWVR